MKLVTRPYKLTLALMITKFNDAIIDSGIVDFSAISNVTERMNQLLFGAYNALDKDGKALFQYGDNEVTAISKIAHGRQNVGYAMRNLILTGKYSNNEIKIDTAPISPEGIKYICDNYMTREQVLNLIQTIKEVIDSDSEITNKSFYHTLLSNKQEADFLYNVLVHLAIIADIKKSPVDEVLAAAKSGVSKMSEVLCEAYDYERKASLPQDR